jgi:hypothetical protein
MTRKNAEDVYAVFGSDVHLILISILINSQTPQQDAQEYDNLSDI